ncbi:porin family protein [Paradesertivirga mongoliensis]|uniref:Porin family protein n=1 Tax=Paradesertivirga mongoliensis TaxID=2100740 RepID=A0ABW4ZN74_9SPHI|nr:porin family protein [Pedobacter mongoliensis]
MKRFTLILGVFLASTVARAQIIPNFDFGLKAGVNLSKLSEQNSFSSENRAGYLAGVWARMGAMGLHLQPELYYTVKTTDIKDANGQSGSIDFASVDLPILIGTKIGAVGIGGRINTGPVISFIVNEEQSFSDALSNAAKFNYKDQALAWQFGVGLDIRKISFDLRYEHGLSKISRPGFEDTKLRLYNFSLGYKLY